MTYSSLEKDTMRQQGADRVEILPGLSVYQEGVYWNEFLLVLIGVVLAMILNQFHANYSHKRKIISDMRDAESGLQAILVDLQYFSIS